MKRTTSILFFIVGLGIFGYLVWQFGIDQLIANIERAGWTLLYVILVWFCIYVLNTLAWKIILTNEVTGISLSRMFVIKVAGFTINSLTPFVGVGGEPFQVKVLGDLVGTKRSLSAVILYRMIHLLGHMSLLLCGCLYALLFLPLTESLKVFIGIACIVNGIIIYFTLSGHRNGIFVRLKERTEKFAWIRTLWSKFADSSGSLYEMDEVITGVYTNHRTKFYLAVFCEFSARLLMGVEVYIILHGIGISISYPLAIFVYVFYSIMINIMFFIPMNLGAREGGLILGLQSLAIPSMLGVYLGVVIRIREFFWILFGLLFILFSMNRRTPNLPVIDNHRNTIF